MDLFCQLLLLDLRFMETTLQLLIYLARLELTELFELVLVHVVALLEKVKLGDHFLLLLARGGEKMLLLAEAGGRLKDRLHLHGLLFSAEARLGLDKDLHVVKVALGFSENLGHVVVGPRKLSFGDLDLVHEAEQLPVLRAGRVPQIAHIVGMGGRTLELSVLSLKLIFELLAH